MTVGNLASEMGFVSIVDITGAFSQDEKEVQIMLKLMVKLATMMMIQKKRKSLEFVDPM